jgi:hypothetical protein
MRGVLLRTPQRFREERQILHHKIDVLKVRPKGEGYLPESPVCEVITPCVNQNWVTGFRNL